LKLTDTPEFQSLFKLVSTYAFTIVDLSYGITSNKKIELGYSIASPLLGVMVDDLKSKIPLEWLTQKYAGGRAESLEYRDAKETSEPSRERKVTACAPASEVPTTRGETMQARATGPAEGLMVGGSPGETGACERNVPVTASVDAFVASPVGSLASASASVQLEPTTQHAAIQHTAFQPHSPQPEKPPLALPARTAVSPFGLPAPGDHEISGASSGPSVLDFSPPQVFRNSQNSQDDRAAGACTQRTPRGQTDLRGGQEALAAKCATIGASSSEAQQAQGPAECPPEWGELVRSGSAGGRLDLLARTELTPQAALAAQAAQVPQAYSLSLPQPQVHHSGQKGSKSKRLSVDEADPQAFSGSFGDAPPPPASQEVRPADASLSGGATRPRPDSATNSPSHFPDDARAARGQAGKNASGDQIPRGKGLGASVSSSLPQAERADEAESSTAQRAAERVEQQAEQSHSFISRIYCSDEAHLYAILNMLTLSDAFRPYLVRDRSSIYPLNYLSSITFVLYEMRVLSHPPRYLVEVYFSQGESSDVFQMTKRNALPVDVPELLMRPVPFHIITGLNSRIFRQCRKQSGETLVTVLGIYRHADRSPKQRLKFCVDHEKLVYRLMLLLGVDMQAPKDLTIWADKDLKTLLQICDTIEGELRAQEQGDSEVCNMQVPAAMRQLDDEASGQQSTLSASVGPPGVPVPLAAPAPASPPFSPLGNELSQLTQNLLVFVNIVRARPPALKVQLKFPAPWRGTLKFTLIAKYGGIITRMGMRQAILCSSLMYQALCDGLALQKLTDERPTRPEANAKGALAMEYYNQYATGMKRFFQGASVYCNDEPRVRATAQSYVGELQELVDADIQFIRERISQEGVQPVLQTGRITEAGGALEPNGQFPKERVETGMGGEASSEGEFYRVCDMPQPEVSIPVSAPPCRPPCRMVLEGEIPEPSPSQTTPSRPHPVEELEAELQSLEDSVFDVTISELDLLSNVSKLARQIMNEEKAVLNKALNSTVNLANTSYRELDGGLRQVVRNVPHTAIEDIGVPATSLKIMKGLLRDLVDQYRALNADRAAKRMEAAHRRELEARQRLEAIERESAMSYCSSRFVGAETARLGDGNGGYGAVDVLSDFEGGETESLIGPGFSELVFVPADTRATSASSIEGELQDKLPDGETLEMVVLRLETVLENFNSGDSGTYDVSKISDIVDMLRYEILQHHSAQTPQIQATIKRAWDVSNALGKFTLSSEYGLTEFRKYAIGSLICDSLLDALVRDMGEPGLHLYFTSESHIYGLLNLLLYAPSSKCQLDKAAVQNLDFMSHFIIKVYSKGQSADISRIEVFWSSGSAHSPYKLDPTSNEPLLRIQTPILLGDDFSREDFAQLLSRNHKLVGEITDRFENGLDLLPVERV